MAQKVADNAGVYLVPAFVGLGAPYWDSYARGGIQGLTRAANKYHIVRAALESMAYQTADVLSTMQKEIDRPITSLRVDGGASANDFLMQFQADVLGVPILRPACVETTAWGAASLAGLAAGVYADRDELRRERRLDRSFAPTMPIEEREALLGGWHRAVERSLAWAEN
jgi:glycerol kinase